MVNTLVRRVGAAVVALTLVALVACDLWVGGFRAWWDRHSLTGSVVSSLLVVAVTALIFDEVVARRQHRERAISVSVQALIVYGQSRRTYGAIISNAGDDVRLRGAPEELRTLAGMLLTASPSLFDDPVARPFLAQAERLMGSMLRTISATDRGATHGDGRDRLASEMSQLKTAVGPLRERIPPEERSVLEEVPE